MFRTVLPLVAMMVTGLILWIPLAGAMSLREFAKFTHEEQGTYIGAAVNMLAYTYAVQGNVEKARCIKAWYSGTKDSPGRGPHEVASEIFVAEKTDPDKFHVEGIIMGVADRACPMKAQSAKP